MSSREKRSSRGSSTPHGGSSALSSGAGSGSSGSRRLTPVSVRGYRTQGCGLPADREQECTVVSAMEDAERAAVFADVSPGSSARIRATLTAIATATRQGSNDMGTSARNVCTGSDSWQSRVTATAQLVAAAAARTEALAAPHSRAPTLPSYMPSAVPTASLDPVPASSAARAYPLAQPPHANRAGARRPSGPQPAVHAHIDRAASVPGPATCASPAEPAKAQTLLRTSAPAPPPTTQACPGPSHSCHVSLKIASGHVHQLMATMLPGLARLLLPRGWVLTGLAARDGCIELVLDYQYVGPQPEEPAPWASSSSSSAQGRAGQPLGAASVELPGLLGLRGRQAQHPEQGFGGEEVAALVSYLHGQGLVDAGVEPTLDVQVDGLVHSVVWRPQSGTQPSGEWARDAAGVWTVAAAEGKAEGTAGALADVDAEAGAVMQTCVLPAVEPACIALGAAAASAGGEAPSVELHVWVPCAGAHSFAVRCMGRFLPVEECGRVPAAQAAHGAHADASGPVRDAAARGEGSAGLDDQDGRATSAVSGPPGELMVLRVLEPPASSALLHVECRVPGGAGHAAQGNTRAGLDPLCLPAPVLLLCEPPGGTCGCEGTRGCGVRGGSGHGDTLGGVVQEVCGLRAGMAQQHGGDDCAASLAAAEFLGDLGLLLDAASASARLQAAAGADTGHQSLQPAEACGADSDMPSYREAMQVLLLQQIEGESTGVQGKGSSEGHATDAAPLRQHLADLAVTLLAGCAALRMPATARWVVSLASERLRLCDPVALVAAAADGDGHTLAALHGMVMLADDLPVQLRGEAGLRGGSSYPRQEDAQDAEAVTQAAAWYASLRGMGAPGEGMAGEEGVSGGFGQPSNEQASVVQEGLWAQLPTPRAPSAPASAHHTPAQSPTRYRRFGDLQENILVHSDARAPEALEELTESSGQLCIVSAAQARPLAAAYGANCGSGCGRQHDSCTSGHVAQQPGSAAIAAAGLKDGDQISCCAPAACDGYVEDEDRGLVCRTPLPMQAAAPSARVSRGKQYSWRDWRVAAAQCFTGFASSAHERAFWDEQACKLQAVCRLYAAFTAAFVLLSSLRALWEDGLATAAFMVLYQGGQLAVLAGYGVWGAGRPWRLFGAISSAWLLRGVCHALLGAGVAPMPSFVLPVCRQWGDVFNEGVAKPVIEQAPLWRFLCFMVCLELPTTWLLYQRLDEGRGALSEHLVVRLCWFAALKTLTTVGTQAVHRVRFQRRLAAAKAE